MTNSADPDQLASSEANWSGSALFAKIGISGISRTRVKYWTLSGSRYLERKNVADQYANLSANLSAFPEPEGRHNLFTFYYSYYLTVFINSFKGNVHSFREGNSFKLFLYTFWKVLLWKKRICSPWSSLFFFYSRPLTTKIKRTAFTWIITAYLKGFFF